MLTVKQSTNTRAAATIHSDRAPVLGSAPSQSPHNSIFCVSTAAWLHQVQGEVKIANVFAVMPIIFVSADNSGRVYYLSVLIKI